MIGTERTRTFLTDHEYPLLGILPAGTAELEGENGDLEVDESVFLYGLTSSDVVSAEEFILQTSWKGSQKARIKVLGEAMSSRLKLLKLVAERENAVSLESGETLKYFPMIMSYCHDTAEEKEMIAVWHGAERQHPCVRCRSA